MHSVQNYYQRQKRFSREQLEKRSQLLRQKQQQQQQRKRKQQQSRLQTEKQKSQQYEEQENRKGYFDIAFIISFKSADIIKAIYSEILYGIVISNLSLVLLQKEYIEQFYFEKRIAGGGGVVGPDPNSGNKSLPVTTPEPPPPPNIHIILFSIDKFGTVKITKNAVVVLSVLCTCNSKYSG